MLRRAECCYALLLIAAGEERQKEAAVLAAILGVQDTPMPTLLPSKTHDTVTQGQDQRAIQTAQHPEECNLLGLE